MSNMMMYHRSIARKVRAPRPVDHYHVTAVPEPYRWLEHLDSPQTRARVSTEGKPRAS
jgi:hypothetical protein